MTMRKWVFLDTANEGGAVEGNPNTDESTFGRLTLVGIGGVALYAGGGLISNVGTPAASTDAATKGYVDSAVNGVEWKAPVYALASSSVSALTGAPATIDGVSVAAGRRVLLTAQTTASQNGIWVVNAGAWTRPTDFATGASVAGFAVFVEAGTTYVNQGYLCTNAPGSDIVDTSSLTFVQFTGLGEVTVGNGLSKSGNAIAVALATNPGLQFTGGALDHLLVTGGGLTKNSSGLQVLINSSPLTLQSDTNGLAVIGVPGLFKIAGTAVGSNVTAPNLTTLTASPTSLADALHTHAFAAGAALLQSTLLNGTTALNAGDPVCTGTATALGKGDASSAALSRIRGVAAAAISASASGTIIKAGPAPGVLSGATFNTPYFLAPGGGLTTTVPSGSGYRVVRIGFAINATDLDVQIQDMGTRA